MEDEELRLLQFIAPFSIASLTDKDKGLVAKLLGYEEIGDLITKAKSDKSTVEAMSILSLLHSFSEDRASLRTFFDKLIFTDKELEKRVRRTYNLTEKEALSVTALTAMWELEYEGNEDKYWKKT